MGRRRDLRSIRNNTFIVSNSPTSNSSRRTSSHPVLKIYVVMPAFNASRTIAKVFARIPRDVIIKISGFIVIDDGSNDNTMREIKRLKRRYHIMLARHKKNQGYGSAQKSGFRLALKHNADVVVLLHSDGQYPPEMLGKMVEPLLSGKADIVGGSRWSYGRMLGRGMPVHKYIGNFLLTGIMNLAFRKRLSCYHSGYKAYSKKALESIDFSRFSDKFDFDSEMLVASFKHNLKIIEIPIPTHYGDEVSYLKPMEYGLGILRIIGKYIRGYY
ncbi:glycosyltransferase family 2 protein [Candidatus Woesearchaeota archaeon]|nr:glycosyltransferase family 2 protein [Candidatus Woesearchaeota archaeon]